MVNHKSHCTRIYRMWMRLMHARPLGAYRFMCGAECFWMGSRLWPHRKYVIWVIWSLVPFSAYKYLFILSFIKLQYYWVCHATTVDTMSCAAHRVWWFIPNEIYFWQNLCHRDRVIERALEWRVSYARQLILLHANNNRNQNCVCGDVRFGRAPQLFGHKMSFEWDYIVFLIRVRCAVHKFVHRNENGKQNFN